MCVGPLPDSGCWVLGGFGQGAGAARGAIVGFMLFIRLSLYVIVMVASKLPVPCNRCRACVGNAQQGEMPMLTVAVRGGCCSRGCLLYRAASVSQCYTCSQSVLHAGGGLKGTTSLVCDRVGHGRTRAPVRSRPLQGTCAVKWVGHKGAIHHQMQKADYFSFMVVGRDLQQEARDTLFVSVPATVADR